jgi:Protein of unknown function (DUF1524)
VHRENRSKMRRWTAASLPFVGVAAVSAMFAFGAPTASAEPPPAPDATEARQLLGQLTVAEPHSMDGYDRDRFPHWSDQGDSCNTREVVLKRDGDGVETGSDCYPTAGSWFSIMDEQTVSEPSDATVDHMVPLANAWRSGADEWDDTKRGDFANDLEHAQLIIATQSANSSKGDQAPDEWKPPNTDYHCDYARQWIHVKSVWTLNITETEKGALDDMLNQC